MISTPRSSVGFNDTVSEPLCARLSTGLWPPMTVAPCALPAWTMFAKPPSSSSVHGRHDAMPIAARSWPSLPSSRGRCGGSRDVRDAAPARLVRAPHARSDAAARAHVGPAARDGRGPGRLRRRHAPELRDAGGMGEVYAAYDPELDRKVAVKLLRARQRGPKEGARLLREAQAIAKLSHPNVVVVVYDVGTFDDQVFIAMEFVDGHTLGLLDARAHAQLARGRRGSSSRPGAGWRPRTSGWSTATSSPTTS